MPLSPLWKLLLRSIPSLPPLISCVVLNVRRCWIFKLIEKDVRLHLPLAILLLLSKPQQMQLSVYSFAPSNQLTSLWN